MPFKYNQDILAVLLDFQPHTGSGQALMGSVLWSGSKE